MPLARTGLEGNWRVSLVIFCPLRNPISHSWHISCSADKRTVLYGLRRTDLAKKKSFDIHSHSEVGRALFPRRTPRKTRGISFGAGGPGVAAGGHRAGCHFAFWLSLLAGRGRRRCLICVH